MKGCDEELGIATFGWPDNSDNAWSAEASPHYKRLKSDTISVPGGG